MKEHVWPPMPAGWPKIAKVLPRRELITSWSLPMVIEATCPMHGKAYFIQSIQFSAFFCEVHDCRWYSPTSVITPDGCELYELIEGEEGIMLPGSVVHALRESFIQVRHQQGSQAVAAAEMGQ